MTGLSLDDVSGEERLGFWPWEKSSEASEARFREVYHNMRSFIESNGPFDGMMCFSEGASIGATVMIADAQKHARGEGLGIRCAIFFCGVTPLDLNLDEDGERKGRFLDPEVDGLLLRVPTAHIWSKAGDVLPGMGEALLKLCDESMREELLHDLGHDVPGARSDAWLREAVRVIRRTIERAKASG